MIISIKGLTGATIMINSLKIVLRGETSIYNIKITDDEQMREIVTLKNAKLLIFRTEDGLSKTAFSEVPVQKQPPLEEEIDDGSETPEISEDEEASSVMIEDKPVNPIAKQPIKKIVKASTEEEEKKDDVTIMTLSGPRTAKMVRSRVGDMPETEATRASIEALKKMEDEEAEIEENEDILIDESNLPMNERMGLSATVGTGKNSTQVKMRNSMIPESEISARARAKGKNIKFIKSVDDGDDRDNSAFIDKDKANTDKVEVSNAFIESGDGETNKANEETTDSNDSAIDISKTGEY